MAKNYELKENKLNGGRGREEVEKETKLMSVVCYINIEELRNQTCGRVADRESDREVALFVFFI